MDDCNGGAVRSVCENERSGPASRKRIACAAVASLLLVACTGDDGRDGDAPQPATPDELDRGERSPGVVLDVLGLSGGTGPGGSFRVGDRISVAFRVTKDDGTDWRASELDLGRILVSGPTSAYQRVIAEKTDLITAARIDADGSFGYTFTDPIPPAYLPPLNDTDSFGELDGERAGQALSSGTYTVGLYAAWDYTVEGESFRDVANATVDFLLGGAQTLQRREVVGLDNCNQCHGTLQAHGGTRRDVKLCVLCHTAGAEDRNVAEVEGGTPGVSIDFRVMIHKLHSGAHLASVLGIATNPDGSRDYSAAPRPYRLVGYQDRVSDFSSVRFPRMPGANVRTLLDPTGTTYAGAAGNGPMPRDAGYAALPPAHKRLEDAQRSGVVDCDACHGDPDGAGPLAAPAQGENHRTQPSRMACGSCHDDVDWSRRYNANGASMRVQDDDSLCNRCHAPSGTGGDKVGGTFTHGTGVLEAHMHPTLDPDHDSGLELVLTGVGGGTGPLGRHRAGDPVEVTFTLTNREGEVHPVQHLSSFRALVSGPHENPQWVLPDVELFDLAFRPSVPFTGDGTISRPVIGALARPGTIAVVFTGATGFDVLGSLDPPLTGQAIGAAAGSNASVEFAGVSFAITQGATAFAAGDRWTFEVVPAAPSYTLHVPRDVTLELLGTATGAGQSLPVANAPIYRGRQAVFERGPQAGPAAFLLAPAAALARHVEADSALLPWLIAGDTLVIDDEGPLEEYLVVGRIQTTDDRTGADLGPRDRLWFTAPLRYAHAPLAPIRAVVLSAKREGLAYTLEAVEASAIELLPGQFAPGSRVVASYRTHGRFGFRDAPGVALQLVYPPAASDSEEIDASAGDWAGLPLVDGTYTVGLWASRDFAVNPDGMHAATGTWGDAGSDDTTYRMSSAPATLAFPYGDAALPGAGEPIVRSESCSACHGDVQAHGARGLETCLLCHRTPGAEDGAPYASSGWYVPPTPGVTVDFRTLMHRLHMGRELARAPSHAVGGVFLGTPYLASCDQVAFPSMPGGAMDCEKCHGQGSTSWHAPSSRAHPAASAPPARDWRAVCAACHDSDAAAAHIAVQTSTDGEESCAICHGPGEEWSVALAHEVR